MLDSSKIIEKIIYNRLYAHIDKNNIIVNEKYRFRTNTWTEQAAYMLINGILTAINNYLVVGGVFCDLQKAFDCVNHKILIDKLEFYVIKGKFKTLIESYLTWRYQTVALSNTIDNSKSSSWEEIRNGVQQGLILSPLFFLFYINDLPKTNEDTTTILCADDTSIFVTGQNKVNFNININQPFRHINTWFKENFRTLNYTKTQYLEFKTKHYCNVNAEITCDRKCTTKASKQNFLDYL